ncbi:alphaherpesvirus glycoprotein E domain protein [Rhizoctonia solani]|uniref:Alphaherpesvirus glycoprotein E domain protein n=1 Tax=Rhizoctonia solani TaxID=456999 RepID=A0A8H8NMZ1_9AGAM|nr:alphaherpesvirus glycoprotein E domain protein [Rhizoctonia solani]QRW16145.1 alphaherpesvirus glycoprotein E domain protein [Rhizoctonia solani]
MTSSHGYSSSSSGSTPKSTARSQSRAGASTIGTIFHALTASTVASRPGRATRTRTRTSTLPTATGTNKLEPFQNGTSQLTVGLAVGIGFLLLAILSILFLFYLRRRRSDRQATEPTNNSRQLQQPNLDEKRPSRNGWYSGYSSVSAPLWTVDEEREDEESIGEGHSKRSLSTMIPSVLGRFTWLSPESNRLAGTKNTDMQHRTERLTQPPPVSRGRHERYSRR